MEGASVGIMRGNNEQIAARGGGESLIVSEWEESLL